MKNKNFEFLFKEVSDSGQISGYLNNFGNKDYAGDVTVKGAFSKSLTEIKNSGRDLPMLWQHEHDQPIGVWKNVHEDRNGLFAVGQINMETQKGKEAHSLAKQGALTGISIGYFVVDEEFDVKDRTNYLKEVSLLEASLVTFPCNDESRIEEVKHIMDNDELPTKREIEKTLKEAGFSNRQAKLLASKFNIDDIETKEGIVNQEGVTGQEGINGTEQKEPMMNEEEKMPDADYEDKEPEMNEEEKEIMEDEMKSFSNLASLFTK